MIYNSAFGYINKLSNKVNIKKHKRIIIEIHIRLMLRDESIFLIKYDKET